MTKQKNKEENYLGKKNLLEYEMVLPKDNLPENKDYSENVLLKEKFSQRTEDNFLLKTTGKENDVVEECINKDSVENPIVENNLCFDSESISEKNILKQTENLKHSKKRKKKKSEMTFDERYNPENYLSSQIDSEISDYKNINDFDKKIIEKSNKIKYRGPFGYRSIKIFAVAFILLPFAFFRLSVSFPSMSENLASSMMLVLSFLKDVAQPLIILSAFCFVLSKPKELKGRIRIYFFIALCIYLAIVVAFYHYVVPIIKIFNPDLIETANIYAEANRETLAKFSSIINYNIFIDLFLCTLFFFFTNYTPKNLTGKKLKLFRWCAFIPVLYVVGSILLYGLFANSIIELEVWQFALLTCRSPASYFVFFSLSLYLAFSKRKYIQKGGTISGYNIYQKTNSHTLQFSVYCSITVAAVSLLDYLLSFIPNIETWLFGNSYKMVFIIPFIMLLCYTREYKNKTIDAFLPIIMVGAIVFLVVDAVFTMLVH